MTTTKTRRDDSQQTKYENLDKLNLSQPFNKVQYHCKDCEEIWNTSEYLKEFSQNQENYGGFVSGAWHKIIRSIHENLFRPRDRLIGTVCPNCCGEHERKSGNIKTSLEARKTDEKMLERLAENHGLYFEQALKKLWHVGKEINHDGEVIER